MSVLPLAQMCGQAARLNEKYGAGRAAAKSKAFHATCAGVPEARTLFNLLTREEQEDIAEWKRPVTMVLEGGGVVLDYDSAEKELTLALDCWGMPCLESDPDCATVGHMDFGWVREVVHPPIFCDGEEPCANSVEGKCQGHSGVTKVAYVGDIKKQRWTSAGPDTLQLHAYGLAYALLRDCDAYVTGRWLATEGEWDWSHEMVVLGSERAEGYMAQILAAASHEGEASPGGHCDGCWARLHCPEWVMPVEQAVAPDSLLVSASWGQIDPSRGAELIHELDRLRDVLKRARENVEQMVTRGHLKVLDSKTGKRWAPVKMPGRTSVDKSAMAADGINPDKYMKRGEPYEQFRWLKA